MAEKQDKQPKVNPSNVQQVNMNQIHAETQYQSMASQPKAASSKPAQQQGLSQAPPPVIDDPNDFRNVALQILTKKCEWVRISNEKGPKRGTMTYELFINKQSIRITEKEQGQKNVFLFDLRDNKLLLNNELQAEEEWDGFVKKLNNIGKDLGDNKAQMYEKPLPPARR
tara:strand:+ start:328 stop:834 length:507 start_codon:yes stop_codon:yes gene_type:complete